MRLLTVILGAVLFTSCFEVVEEWTLNDDGSGTWQLSINASQSRTELDAIAVLDSFRGYAVPNKETVLKRVHELVGQFNTMDSVTARVVQVDSLFYMMDLEVTFLSISALNRAIDQMEGKDSVRTQIGKTPASFYRLINLQDTRPFKRITNVNLNDAKYTRICRFDQVIVNPPPELRVAPNGKACMFQASVNSISNHPEYLNFTINLAQ